MNLPNQLTTGRLVLTMLFVASMTVPMPLHYSLGLLLFIIASITDYLDGKIARSRGLITTFGKLMDPLADKVLICSAFVLLCSLDLPDGNRIIPAWVVIVILTREFLVTGLRLVATSQGTVLAAESLGKYKTTFQIATSIYFLALLASEEMPFAWLRPLYDLPILRLEHAGTGLIGITLLATAASGISYALGNRHLLHDA